MIDRRPNGEPTAYDDDDDFADRPPAGVVPQWVGGVAAPLLLTAYGIHCLFTGRATLFGRGGTSMTVHGPDAVAVAGATVCIGVFLHCHSFWGNVYHLAAWAVLGKIVSLVGMLVSLVYLLVHLGLLGRGAPLGGWSLKVGRALPATAGSGGPCPPYIVLAGSSISFGTASPLPHPRRTTDNVSTAAAA